MNKTHTSEQHRIYLREAIRRGCALLQYSLTFSCRGGHAHCVGSSVELDVKSSRNFSSHLRYLLCWMCKLNSSSTGSNPHDERIMDRSGFQVEQG